MCGAPTAMITWSVIAPTAVLTDVDSDFNGGSLTVSFLANGAAEDLLGDQPDRERLAGAGSGDDAEALPLAGELANLLAVVPLEEGVDVKADRELDRFACRARGGDDDDASGGRLGRHERVVIER